MGYHAAGARRAALFFLALALVATAAAAKPFDGIPVEEVLITTEDGVTEKLIHLSNPGRPIVLLEPGLGAQGMSLQLPAEALYRRGGYDVFIGNWRGSVELPEGSTPFGDRNGLTEVTLKDFPAHLRHILRNYASAAQKAQGIALFGHSMGGMMILSTLSDPRLQAEFKAHIKSVVLFQAPHHVGYVQAHLKMISRAAGPLLSALRSRGVSAINQHSQLLTLRKKTKAGGGLAARAVVPVLERLVSGITRFALNPAHTHPRLFHRAVFKMAAWSIPLDLLEDFAAAVNNGGEFRLADGRPLIVPEMLADLPVQVVRTRLDTLAPWKQQRELFERIASPRKQLLSVHDMTHIDPVLVTRAESDFFHHVLDFMSDPRPDAPGARELVFHPDCESLLTRLTGGRLRLRKI